MKKTYIMPLMEVVKTETEQMICESDPTINVGGVFSEGDYTPASKEDLDAIFEGLW